MKLFYTLPFVLQVRWLLLASRPVTAMQRKDNQRFAMFTRIQNRILVGHVIERKTSVSSPFACAAYCSQKPECTSCNRKSNGVCELLNVTVKTEGVSLQEELQSSHYHDKEIESCLEYYQIGERENGIYTIADENGARFHARCDFTSEPGLVWTMVLSFARKNRGRIEYCKRALGKDGPRNEDSPNWDDYRLSLSRMQYIARHSTHWRATTDFNVVGVDYIDYVKGNFADFNIIQYNQGGSCQKVDFVHIRGHTGTKTTAMVFQKDGTYLFHIDSRYRSCGFNSYSGSVSYENNFGFYCQSDSSMNLNFRGTKTDDSTTQYWFGSQV